MTPKTAEALIGRLRNRRGRIVAYAVTSVACAVISGMYWWHSIRLTSQLVPAENDDPLLHLTTSQAMLPSIVMCYTFATVWALGLGLSVGKLVGELATYTKNQLLVELWDRVTALEKSQKKR